MSVDRFVPVLLALACAPGADPDDAPALGPDVEGVASREVALTLTVVSDDGDATGDVDVDGDGVDDFEIALSRDASGDDTILFAELEVARESNELLVADLPNAGSNGGTDTGARALALGDRVEGSSARWEAGGVLHEIEAFQGEVEDDYGVAGAGRVLLGVRFLHGVSDLLNGWIEVSVDEDLTTVTVHRSGWAELPEVGLGAGDR